MTDSRINPVIVTTSWDDGHKLDLRLAEMLRRHGVKATFYISPRTTEFAAAERLTADEIRLIARDFEIGAHTMTHPHLSRLPAAAARQEITASKAALELITGHPVRSFCYPYGDYSPETKRLVREAGFSTARSITRFVTRSVDPMAMGTSADAFDHRRDGMASVLRLAGGRPWRAARLRRWDELAQAMLAQAREQGGVFHLWGHARDLEAHRLWGRLDQFLAWLRAQPGVTFAVNSEVRPAVPRLLIASPYFKPRTGGVEEYAYQIAKGLQDSRDWQVSVVTSGDKDEMLATSYRGLRVHHLPYRFKLSNTPVGPGWRRALKRVVDAERPDIIVAHAPVAGILDAAARYGRKTPLVVAYHQTSMVKGQRGPDLLIRCYERLLLPRALRRARAIICASPVVRDSAIITPFLGKSVVISPGVATDEFRPGPPGPRGRRIMHVGGLKTGEGHKGLETSLRVTAELGRTHPGVSLAVVGDGDRQPQFEKLAAELGITPLVTFAGRLAGQQLVSAYQSADVLLMPSRREAFGLVLVEAMACGVPVVASAVENIPDLLRDGEFGFLVDPDDVSGFARRIGELLDDPARGARFAARARRAAVAEVRTWADQVERTAALLESVL